QRGHRGRGHVSERRGLPAARRFEAECRRRLERRRSRAIRPDGDHPVIDKVSSRMHSKVALLLAVTAIFAAACNRETKKNEVVTTTTNAARGTGETTTPATQSSTATSPQPASGVEVGDAMPAYTAPLLDGSELDIAKQKGSVVLLNIWATWRGQSR